MSQKKNEHYTDFSNVEDQRRFLATEEFPEGSFGVKGNDKEFEPVKNKETPWEEGQQYTSPFAYENRTLHENEPRIFPESHYPHDEDDEGTKDPFNDQADQ